MKSTTWHLSEGNSGRHKTELVSGLCSNKTSKLPPCKPTKHKKVIAAFKYIMNYLLNREYLSSLRVACQSCNTDSSGLHSCILFINDTKRKNDALYYLLNTIDKKALKNIFGDVERSYVGLDDSSTCSCILYYKCLTVWRPTMRKLFLSDFIPRGLDSDLMSIIQDSIQTWENRQLVPRK